ncbi:GM12192 [Drosophila sechellia]|uniref:GM12192 n=1 Tax=Drosophila sechellia TaxID=7238 RepID=B4HWB8_DROSE|nr:GM12192 [Drosophila sechellia]
MFTTTITIFIITSPLIPVHHFFHFLIFLLCRCRCPGHHCHFLNSLYLCLLYHQRCPRCPHYPHYPHYPPYPHYLLCQK